MVKPWAVLLFKTNGPISEPLPITSERLLSRRKQVMCWWVSYVGYQRKEIKVTNSDVITVSIAQELSKLEDVVVIGYGKAKRANLTSAQTTISSKDMEKTLNTTIEQAIQGRSAGVYVTQILVSRVAAFP